MLMFVVVSIKVDVSRDVCNTDNLELL